MTPFGGTSPFSPGCSEGYHKFKRASSQNILINVHVALPALDTVDKNLASLLWFLHAVSSRSLQIFNWQTQEWKEETLGYSEIQQRLNQFMMWQRVFP